MYGFLQGNNKDEMRQKYGKEQVHIWRRSFETAPEKGESLKDTAKRTLPSSINVTVASLSSGDIPRTIITPPIYSQGRF